MPRTLHIDFVSDIVCPWCVVGLGGLTTALETLKGEGVAADITFQPFELNPQLGREGEDIGGHLQRKYGLDEAQVAENQQRIRQRGAELGVVFDMDARSRIVNTFDAHRLLHWAGLQGEAPQLALKRALLAAYHGRGERVDHADVLLAAVRAAGLDEARARAILAGDDYADAVRAAEQQWLQAGIRSVPSVVINDRHLISGGQPVEVFEQALRQLAQG